MLFDPYDSTPSDRPVRLAHPPIVERICAPPHRLPGCPRHLLWTDGCVSCAAAQELHRRHITLAHRQRIARLSGA